MRKYCLLALLLALTGSVQIQAQNPSLPEVTLYSPIKHGPTNEKSHFSFETGSLVTGFKRWDLSYGSLYVGEEHDWFRVSANRNCRSIIKDLGALSWTDSFSVPVVEPFPKLEKGEQRQITVNASGADAKPGPSGAGPVPAPFGLYWPSEQNRSTNLPPAPQLPTLSNPRPTSPPPPPARRAKQDGVPKIDPIFVKAVVGHIYIIHVVDGGMDYSALFRVESLERGDHATISWKLLSTPKSSVIDLEK